MTWKWILKLSPEDRKKFTALGEEYAYEDMEKDQLNRNMKNRAIQIDKDTKKYEAMKEKVEAKKSEIVAKEPHMYEAMQRTLEFMKESVGTRQFDMQRQALLSLSSGYNIFFRGK